MRYILPILLFVTLIGCAPKLPPNTGHDSGIIAIPVDAKTDFNREYFFYYKVHTDLQNAEPITIYPGRGEFAFSEPLPPGEYVLDVLDVLAHNTPRTSTSIAKKSRGMYLPVKVEAGHITIVSHLFKVRCVKDIEAHYYFTKEELKPMTDPERMEYIEMLRAFENAEGWVVK